MTKTPSKSLVFLHIPKTAGQTVHSELARILGEAAVSPVRLHTQVKTTQDQFPTGFRLYSGHLDWDDLSVLPKERFSFTVLRDPLERIASFYFFLLRQAHDAPPDLLASPQGQAMRAILAREPDHFFLRGNENWQTWLRDHFDNLQANYLATGQIRGRQHIADIALPDLVDRAIANSANIDGIYTTTSLGQLEQDLAPHLGTQPALQDRRVNAAPLAPDAKRWPDLAELLGPKAAAHVARFADADRAVIDRLGLSI